MDLGRSRHPYGRGAGAKTWRLSGDYYCHVCLSFRSYGLDWVLLGRHIQPEGKMRFLVLLVASIAVTGGFVVLEQALHEASDKFYVSLGAISNILAQALPISYFPATSSRRLRYRGTVMGKGATPPAILSPSEVFDALLFIACVLTYLSPTLTFTVCMGARPLARAWCDRRAGTVICKSWSPCCYS